MYERASARVGLNSPTLKRLRLIPLLLLALSAQLPRPPVVLASARRTPTLRPPRRQEPAGAQAPQGVTALEQGRPVVRELSGGQRHAYGLALAAGQYAV